MITSSPWPKLLRQLVQPAIVFYVILIAISGTQAATPDSGDALYFSLQPVSPLPSSPSSLLIQSPSLIQVPQGATLSVYLLRQNILVATSVLEFQQAVNNDKLVPPVAIASFLPPGSSISPGQPFPGATLKAGVADLSLVASAPSQYRLLWILSSGIMASPGIAVATGFPLGLVELKLNAVSATSFDGDQKPGSVLFFNRYTSSASNPLLENTKLNITNTNPVSTAYLRIFFVNGSTCETTNYGICLAAQQTVSFELSDLDPGIKGYAVAVATNALGEPIQYNWLIGNVVVKQSGANLTRPYSSVLGALAITKRNSGVVANSGGSAEMVFDDANYDRLPGQIAFDSVPSQFIGLNLTTISMFRPTPNLIGEVAGANVQLTGWGKNNQNQVITSGGGVSVACYHDYAVSTLRLAPTTVGQLIPSGSTGWFAAATLEGQPLLGSQFNSGDFSGGGNARPLTVVSEYKIRMPVIPITCQ